MKPPKEGSSLKKESPSPSCEGIVGVGAEDSTEFIIGPLDLLEVEVLALGPSFGAVVRFLFLMTSVFRERGLTFP